MESVQNGLPVDFQNQINTMALSFVQADLARFLVFFPRRSLNQAAYSRQRNASMEDAYNATHWHKDPMHPSLYDDTDQIVLNSATLMDANEWMAGDFYRDFLAPHGLCHVMDTFFRQAGKIVGVLTLCRRKGERPFDRRDEALVAKLQPFMEYTLGKVFMPRRITERQKLSEKYQLTARELNVMEYALAGISNKELVRHLKMSLPTLRTHLQHIYQKVGVHSNSAMISKVLRETGFPPVFDD